MAGVNALNVVTGNFDHPEGSMFTSPAVTAVDRNLVAVVVFTQLVEEMWSDMGCRFPRDVSLAAC